MRTRLAPFEVGEGQLGDDDGDDDDDAKRGVMARGSGALSSMMGNVFYVSTRTVPVSVHGTRVKPQATIVSVFCLWILHISTPILNSASRLERGRPGDS